MQTDSQAPGNVKVANKTRRALRGVFEKVPGSGVWWIRYADASGRIRREKVGNRGAALQLYQKRKTQVLQGNKLPENLRRRLVKFSEIAEDTKRYCKNNNQGQQFDLYRIGRLIEAFGDRPAELTITEIREWFEGQTDWKDGTFNRYRTMLSLIFRLATENGKVTSNPARLLKHKREDNGRVRFLNQFTPAQAEIEYLKPLADEESRLRAVIEHDYPDHLPELVIALHTGMRPSEQYGLTWDRVDLVRRHVSLLKTKNGNARHIPLNAPALAAFQELFGRSKGEGRVFIGKNGGPLQGYKHWFEDSVKKAGLRDFTWYCLRHTFASRLVMAGVDLRTIAELMGHKTIQMTMRYAHLAPAHKLSAVERLVVQPVAAQQANEAVAAQERATDTRTDTRRVVPFSIGTRSVQ